MPQLIIGHSLKSQVEKYPLLRKTLWFIEGLVFRLFFGLVSLLPVETAARLGQRATLAIGPRLKKHKVFRRNVDHAFAGKTAPEREQILQGIWANLGAIIGEFPHLQTICHDENHRRLKICVAGHIDALQKPCAKPAIFVMGHISNWEVAGAALAQMGVPCADAYTPMGNPWLDRMIAKYRKPLEVELFPRSESMRPMVKHLAAGKSLAFVMDQRIDNGQPVPFFGIDKKTTVVPAKLGLKHDCEIVPLRVQRTGTAQYLVTFYPPLRCDEAELPNTEKVLKITRKINEYLERWISESPAEWFPSKRRWDKIDLRNATHSPPTAGNAAHAPD